MILQWFPIVEKLDGLSVKQAIPTKHAHKFDAPDSRYAVKYLPLKSNDGRKYRFQRKMTSAEKRKGSLRTVIDECKKKLKVIHPIFHVTDTYLLKSLPGGPDQFP